MTETERLRAENIAMREALQDAKDALENACDDLGNCIEYRCVPTKNEYKSCKAYLEDARAAPKQPETERIAKRFEAAERVCVEIETAENGAWSRILTAHEEWKETCK